MKRQVVIFLLLGLATVASGAIPRKVVRQAEPVQMTGLEDVQWSGGETPVNRPIPHPLDDWTPGSIVDTAGWTFYDYQSNGTMGKQIGVDAEGFVHVVFTGAPNPQANPRHAYYNVWDPTSQDFTLGTGVQVDASTRAGFVNIVVDPEGWGYPVFHQISVTGGPVNAAAAIDFLPRSGAFTTVLIPALGSRAIIWPHAAIDTAGDLHVVSTENGGASEDFYAKGHPVIIDGFGENIEWPIGFTTWEPANFITIDVAASRHTQKVAVAWLNDSLGSISGNNVYLRVSEDAGQTWGPVRNLTNFQIIDTNCVTNGFDIAVCNGDTLRPWIDLSVLVDDNDIAHVAFSVSSWYYWWTDGSVGPYTLSARPSMIFHWDEFNNTYDFVADGWYGHNDSTASLGVNQLMCHRPNLSQDPATGFLYCSYQKYDSVQINECSHPLADAWVSVSTDGGQMWSEGTNVTNTVGEFGNDRSERDISLATVVTDGFVHMQYLVDHFAGSYVTSSAECDPSNNEIVYQRIPVEDIALEPLLPRFPLRADSTGYWTAAKDQPATLPSSFVLHQNYPNPFNPSTKIQFDLLRAGDVSLKVYDITGREAAVLANGAAMNAGVHVIEFDGASLPSGVYFYRLEAQGQQMTRKMVLLK